MPQSTLMLENFVSTGNNIAVSRGYSNGNSNSNSNSNSKMSQERQQQQLQKLNDLKSKILQHVKTFKQQQTQQLTQQQQQIRMIPTSAVHECHDWLDQLLDIQPMTYDLLQQSKIGKAIHKLSHFKGTNGIDGTTNSNSSNNNNNNQLTLLGKRAQAMILYWNAGLGCRDRALRHLVEFRNVQRRIENQGGAKPDMQAFKHLRHKFQLQRVHGDLPDVPIGLRLCGRGEAAILGIHNSILTGIDAEKDAPCFAICMSGKYNDQEERTRIGTKVGIKEHGHDDKGNNIDNGNSIDDDSDDEGVILYSGMGGLDKQGRLVEDQQPTPANEALMISSMTGDPIRVLKRLGGGVKGGMTYRYEGLYQCVDYTYQPSDPDNPKSPKMYQFTLKPMPFQTVHFIQKYLYYPRKHK